MSGLSENANPKVKINLQYKTQWVVLKYAVRLEKSKNLLRKVVKGRTSCLESDSHQRSARIPMASCSPEQLKDAAESPSSKANTGEVQMKLSMDLFGHAQKTPHLPGPLVLGTALCDFSDCSPTRASSERG